MSDDDSMDFGDFSVSVVVTSPPWYENCFIVSHKKSGEAIVIDPGGDAPHISAAVAKLGVKVKEILLTHGHPDHVGAVGELQNLWKVPCRAHEDERSVVEQAPMMAAMFTGQPGPAIDACDYYSGQPIFELGGATYHIEHTPGHTPGGVCYVFDGFVITGDTLFNHGVGRTDLPGGNEKQLVSSISNLLGKLSEDTVLFSGHGPDWTVGEARGWWQMMIGG